MAANRQLRTGLLAILMLVLVACATSPTGRRQLILVSENEANQMGIAAFAELKKETPAVSSGPEYSRVNCVAKAVTGAISRMPWQVSVPAAWEVVVFKSKEVNAFALPGGKIGVYTGILEVATTTDQLAAIIGHEVAHVLAGHSAERMSQQMATNVGVGVVQAAGGPGQIASMGLNAAFLLPFSRTHETEADLLGVDLMAQAGFDPSASITLWQNMERAAGGQKSLELLSTHPSNSTRINALQQRLSTAMPIYQQAVREGRAAHCS